MRRWIQDYGKMNFLSSTNNSKLAYKKHILILIFFTFVGILEPVLKILYAYEISHVTEMLFVIFALVIDFRGVVFLF